MNNVRCAGGGWWVTTELLPADRNLRVPPALPYGTSESCGWKGERLAEYRMYGVTTQRDILAKPCPRCGGRVELIREAS